jgi:hypothetical protein
MISPYEVASQIYDAKVKSLYNSLIAVAPTLFILGVISAHSFPKAWSYLIVFAAALSFANAIRSYIVLRRSRRALNEYLAELQETDPESVLKLEEMFPE